MKLTDLFTNAFYWGVAETSGEDHFIRQHYRDSATNASLAWTTAQLTMIHPPTDLSLARWVNYYGPPGTIPSFSYYEGLSNAIPSTAISNKVVFVGSKISLGFTGGKGTDDFRTPYTRWTGTQSPGVEISATTYLNLRRGDWLTELPIAGELVLLTFLGIALGFGLAGCRPLAGTAIGLASTALIGSAAIVLVWHTHVWFPWLLVVGVQVPGALFTSILANTWRLQLEKEILTRKLIIAKSGTSRPIFGDNSARPAPAASPAQPLGSFPSFAPGVSSGPVASGGQVPDIAPPFVPDHTMLRCVGQGSYGQVWLARDVIGSYHAVKVIYRTSFKEVTPYEREFRGIQRFTPISRSHPGFVNVLHVGRNDEAGYFYYVMEAGDDEILGQQIDPNTYSPKNLARVLSRRARLPVAECLQLSLNLTSALDQLHQHHLVHRDIKPSNIIFVNDSPKFADIGLVAEIAETGREGSYVGTEGYIPPEGPGTVAADVYSLGKVIYEASTGMDRKDFPHLPNWMVASHGDAMLFQLNKIILRACETDPQLRYPSAAAMHEELLHLEQHKSLKVKRWFWLRRHTGKADVKGA